MENERTRGYCIRLETRRAEHKVQTKWIRMKYERVFNKITLTLHFPFE